MWARGFQSNGYHGESSLSKPPRSHKLTWSVMGLLISKLNLDERIFICLSCLIFFSCVCFSYLKSFQVYFTFLYIFLFFLRDKKIQSHLAFISFQTFSYLRLAKCAITRIVAFQNSLYMTCAVSRLNTSCSELLQFSWPTHSYCASVGLGEML